VRTPNGCQTIVDLHRAEPRLPADMIGFLTGGADALALARETIARAPLADDVALTSVTLKAPVMRPSKIICIRLNYRDHAAEAHQEAPESPTIFAKYPSCLIGSGEAIGLPRISDQVDYEGELAVVIGRRAREVSEADALRYVGGYAPFNDVSARDFQRGASGKRRCTGSTAVCWTRSNSTLLSSPRMLRSTMRLSWLPWSVASMSSARSRWP